MSLTYKDRMIRHALVHLTKREVSLLLEINPKEEIIT
jgi:hypothetical protein